MTWEKFVKNAPMFLMLAINLSVIFYYAEYQDSFKTIMWIYFFQSIFIGLYAFIVNIRHKNYSVSGITVNGAPMKNTNGAKNKLGCFVLFHFTMFHSILGILMGVFMSSKPGTADFRLIFFFIIALFIHYIIKALVYKQDNSKPRSVIATIGVPYLRLLPLFALVFLSSRYDMFTITMVFLGIKTLVDAITMRAGAGIN